MTTERDTSNRKERLTPTQARAARRERKTKKQRFQRIMIVGGVGAISVLFLVALFVPDLSSLSAGSSGDLPDGQRFDNQGEEHIEIGESHAPYNSNPATSGWHYDTPASWGVKTEQLPQERVIHNLEHGGIVIQYNCPDNSCPEEVEALEAIVRLTDETILMPNADMPTRFALTAWNWLLTMDTLDEELAKDFVRSHLNSPNSPEPFAR